MFTAPARTAVILSAEHAPKFNPIIAAASADESSGGFDFSPRCRRGLRGRASAAARWPVFCNTPVTTWLQRQRRQTTEASSVKLNMAQG